VWILRIVPLQLLMRRLILSQFAIDNIEDFGNVNETDKISTASHTYVHVLSLCHLYPFPVTWRVTNVNFHKIIFLCTLLTTFCLAKINEMKNHCCLSQLCFIGTASHTYVHVLSLCHLYPFPVTWRDTNVNFHKIIFSCTLLTTLHIREVK
jgi:hypothetical protein